MSQCLAEYLKHLVLSHEVVEMYGHCISDSYEECENWQLTSAVESSDIKCESGDGLLMRSRRKRVMKNLPEDFVSSQDLKGRQG